MFILGICKPFFISSGSGNPPEPIDEGWILSTPNQTNYHGFWDDEAIWDDDLIWYD